MSLRALYTLPTLRTSLAQRTSLAATRRYITSDPTSKEISQVEERTATAVDAVRPQGDVVAAGPVSGAPVELLSRPVRIFRPAPVCHLSICIILEEELIAG